MRGPQAPRPGALWAVNRPRPPATETLPLQSPRQQAQFPGARDRLGAVVRGQLAVDVLDVPANGARGHDQPRGDLAIRAALRQELQDLALAGTQWLRRAGCRRR